MSNYGTGVDRIPEEIAWPDDGCEVSPHCLTCPLPQCKYDDPAAYRRLRTQQRDTSIATARRTLPVRAVAMQFGLSTRTISRALARVPA